MVDNPALRNWLAMRYGWRVFDIMITDRGFGYTVANNPDPYGPVGSVMNHGNDPLVIVKRTGAVWRLGTTPNFSPAFEALDEKTFYAALATVLPGRDLRQPDDALPADVDLDAPAFTRPALEVWLSRQFGWQVLDGRIRDVGYAYSVSTHPDAFHAGDQSAMTYGSGPLIAIKRTGAVWALGANPVELPIFEATDEASFYAALAAIFPGRHYHPPDYTVSTLTPTRWESADRTQPVSVAESAPAQGLTEEALTDWLRARYGWAVFDGRIRDVDFAFLVNQQPDAYHLGDYDAAQQGVGPLLVVKRTGAVWTFGAEVRLQPLYGAEDEQRFHRMLGDLQPERNPTEPDAFVPLA